MKTVILFLCLSFTIVQGQTSQQNISSEIRTTFFDAVQTPDSGYLMVGAISPSSFDSTGAIVAKFDASLNIVWCKRYKYLEDNDLTTITSTQDGNYLIGGAYRQDFVLDEGGSLTKIDGNGIVLWSQLFSHSHDDRTIKVFENSDNTITLFIRYGVSGRATKFVKTDANGNITTKFILKKGDEELMIDAVATDGTGNFYCTGVVRNDLFQPQIFVIKINNTSVSWAKEYSLGRLSHSAIGIAVLNDGSIALSGQASEAAGGNNLNYLMIHFNSNGTVLNSAELDDGSIELGTGISGTPDNGILMTGYGGLTSFQGTSMRFDSDGNLLWSRYYGDDDGIRIGNNYPLADGRIFILGTMNLESAQLLTTDADGITPCDTYDADLVPQAHVITTTDISVTSETSPVVDISVNPVVSDYPINRETFCRVPTVISGIADQQLFDISIYPNPSCDWLNISNNEARPLQYTIVNASGQLIISGELKAKAENNIPIHDLASGIYFIAELGRHFVVSR